MVCTAHASSQDKIHVNKANNGVCITWHNFFCGVGTILLETANIHHKANNALCSSYSSSFFSFIRRILIFFGPVKSASPGFDLREVHLVPWSAETPRGDVVRTRGLVGGVKHADSIAIAITLELHAEVPGRFRPHPEEASLTLGDLLRRHGGGAGGASSRPAKSRRAMAWCGGRQR
jgi:hypothetical protein